MENPEQELTASESDGTGDAKKAETLENVTDAPSETKEENSDKQDEALSPQSELMAKTEELQTLNDRYLRLAAEFENYKRRTQRDQGDTIRFANEKLLKDLLPTVDNLERALQCSRKQADSEGFLEGVELTYKQFLDIIAIRYSISAHCRLCDCKKEPPTAQQNSQHSFSKTHFVNEDK